MTSPAANPTPDSEAKPGRRPDPGGPADTPWRERLQALGLMRRVAGGIQLDVCAARRRRDGVTTDAPLCDHDCSAASGTYACPAARSLNPGVTTRDLAPAEAILERTRTTAIGLRTGIDRFLAEGFAAYCASFGVPAAIAAAMADILRTAPIEVNLTGGNPEMHPELLDILRELRRTEGLVTNLTTTGGRIMREPEFAARLMENPPALISFSADDFHSPDRIRQLRDLSPGQLRDAHRKIAPNRGQQQKAMEAIAAAGILAEGGAPAVGFNLVLHTGNLTHAVGIIEALTESFPGTDVFPFPAQTGFLGAQGPNLDPVAMEGFIDRMIAVHDDNSLRVPKRLHYWLVLKAACRLHESRPDTAAAMIGGNRTWHCAVPTVCNRYVQVTATPGQHNRPIPGGHLGCGWNGKAFPRRTTQPPEPTPEDVAEHVLNRHLYAASATDATCCGCAFPRLMFDVINTEPGLNKDLLPLYLRLRHRHAGF